MCVCVYVCVCVCVCACVCVCVFVCALLEYLLYCCILTEGECYFGQLYDVFMDLNSLISLKEFHSNVMAIIHVLLCCTGTVSLMTTKGPI